MMSRFDAIVNDLRDFLLPYYITPDPDSCLIMMKIALGLAGIKTSKIKPYGGSISRATENRMVITFKGITRGEAEIFLTYAKNSLNDPNAFLDEDYHNTMDVNWRNDSYYFLISLDAFQKLVHAVKESVATTFPNDLREYRIASEKDPRVSRYKKLQMISDDIKNLEAKYLNDQDITRILAQARIALQKRSVSDVQMYDTCSKLEDLFYQHRKLESDQQLRDVRNRVFDYCGYTTSIPIFFRTQPPEPEAVLLAKQPNCFKRKAKKMVGFFKETCHSAGSHAKSLFICCAKDEKKARIRY